MTRLRTLSLALLAALAPAAARAQDRVYVRPEPGTPVVAAEILIAVGPVDEPDEHAGITYLTARSVTAPVRGVLDSLGAHLEVDQQKDAVSFTVIASPDNWEEATRALLVAIFRDPVDSLATVRQRAATVAELRGREASPADALAREVDAAVFGAEHPWGRPAVGTAESVGRLTVDQVDLFLRRYFTSERAVIAIVGPVEPDAGEALAGFMEPGPLSRPRVGGTERAEAPVHVEYNAITAWVAAVYPVGVDADEEALRMLAELALERVSFGPARRQVYDARAQVVRHAGGGELRLEMVVPPREAEQWGERLHAAVTAYAGEDLAAQVFADRLRRFRGERLLALESPEARARAYARQALLGSRAPRLVDPETLTPERLRRAARALGEPVLVYLGPFEEDTVEEEGS